MHLALLQDVLMQSGGLAGADQGGADQYNDGDDDDDIYPDEKHQAVIERAQPRHLQHTCKRHRNQPSNGGCCACVRT